MSPQLIACLIIFALTVVGFFTNFFSLATVSITSLLALSITGCLDASSALSHFANSNVILIATMSIVAAGFQRTKFCTTLSTSISRVANGSLTKLMFGYCILAALLTQVLSSITVVFSIVAPLCLASADNMGIKPSKVMMPLGIVCIACSSALPIGGGATIAAQLNSMIDVYYGQEMNLMALTDPMKARLPMLIITIAYCTFLAPKLAPNDPIVPPSFNLKAAAAKEPLKPMAEYAGIIIFFGETVALMFASKLGLASWQLTLLGALLMIFFGVIKPQEATKSIPYSLLFLIVGCLAMADALSTTGAGSLIGSGIASLVASVNYNSYIVGAIFFLAPFILTQFMSNVGAMMIFIPIALATSSAIGGSPVGLMILIQTAGLTALLTPMATPAVPYVMGYGGYDQVSLLKQGLPYSILTFVVSVLWTMTLFPLL